MTSDKSKRSILDRVFPESAAAVLNSGDIAAINGVPLCRDCSGGQRQVYHPIGKHVSSKAAEASGGQRAEGCSCGSHDLAPLYHHPKCALAPAAPSERADEGLGFEVERFNGEDGVEVLIRDTDSTEWTSGLAWAKTSPETIVTMLADAYEALTRNSEKCNVPPQGWWCSREKGHEGPCAARRSFNSLRGCSLGCEIDTFGNP